MAFPSPRPPRRPPTPPEDAVSKDRTLSLSVAIESTLAHTHALTRTHTSRHGPPDRLDTPGPFLFRGSDPSTSLGRSTTTQDVLTGDGRRDPEKPLETQTVCNQIPDKHLPHSGTHPPTRLQRLCYTDGSSSGVRSHPVPQLLTCVWTASRLTSPPPLVMCLEGWVLPFGPVPLLPVHGVGPASGTRISDSVVPSTDTLSLKSTRDFLSSEDNPTPVRSDPLRPCSGPLLPSYPDKPVV